VDASLCTKWPSLTERVAITDDGCRVCLHLVAVWCADDQLANPINLLILSFAKFVYEWTQLFYACAKRGSALTSLCDRGTSHIPSNMMQSNSHPFRRLSNQIRQTPSLNPIVECKGAIYNKHQKLQCELGPPEVANRKAIRGERRLQCAFLGTHGQACELPT
jgi:hypothetical protein